MDSVNNEKTTFTEHETIDLERTVTDYAPTYHGLTLKTVLVYLVSSIMALNEDEH
jgi:hypothetical protein